jgi:hypothetical protein
MSDDIVSMVPMEHVHAVWPRVRTYIENVTKYTYGRYEPDDILTLITDYDHTMWIAFREDQIIGTVVTHFLEYPRKRFLSCPFVTGDDFASWKGPMLELLQKWAYDNHCDGLEATARLGFARVFKDDSYEAMWQTFQLPAAEAGLGAANG